MSHYSGLAAEDRQPVALDTFCQPTNPIPPTNLHWFRLDALRLHDNPSFTEAVTAGPGQRVKAIFIIDPWFNANYNRGGPAVNVWRFLLESLKDLDNRLQKKPYCTGLKVFSGQPTVILPKLIRKWNVVKITFQASQVSSESAKHDEIVSIVCAKHNAAVSTYFSHTLYDPLELVRLNGGQVPLSYKDFRRLLPLLGKPPDPLPEPSEASIMPFIQLGNGSDGDGIGKDGSTKIPSLQDLGFPAGESLYTNLWVGGETEAFSRLSRFFTKRAFHSDDPTSWLMNKDSLSPYLRFGCLSVRQFFSQLKQFASTSGKGQQLFEQLTKNLLLREFSFLVGYSVPNLDVMKDNPLCIQLPWDENPHFLQSWREGRTGYPWIDAVIRQMRLEGWAHFLARQSVAVFLTRGYLWVSWVHGKDFFQEFMLDFELPVSSVCWMQSSCSGFFCNQVESYDPCLVGKQMDPEGRYIKTYLPELKDYPSDFVHMPWMAPLYIQKQANCVIGEDYPKPIVDVCEQGALCCKRIQSIMQALQLVYSS